MTTTQKIMFVLLGMVFAVAIFCATVGIGCAINEISFGEQIVQWFGTSAPVVDGSTETTASILNII